jgi:hypothetical protein
MLDLIEHCLLICPCFWVELNYNSMSISLLLFSPSTITLLCSME